MTLQILLIVTIVSFIIYVMWNDYKKDKEEEKLQEQQRAAAAKVVSEENFHNPDIPYNEKLRNLHYLQLKKDKETVHSLAYNTEDLLLTDLLLHVHGNFGYYMQSLKIINTTIDEITNHEAIMGYKVLDAIICDNTFICDQAVLLIKYVNIDEEYNDQFIATLTLEAKEENDECLMVRATLTTPPIDRQGYHAAPYTYTLMMSLDKMEHGQKQAYFEYMLKEALNANSDSLYTLDPIQLDILSQQNASPARNIFFGNKYFEDKRYYNALLHLEKAYSMMRPIFRHLNDYWQRAFFDVCYKIGYCFCDMGNYSSAIYYLELTEPLKSILYTIEYINALVNSGDLRAMYTIDKTLENVQRQISDAAANDKEVDTDIAGFYNFLRRRKGYTLIELGYLDAAEELLKQMLNEPSNHDYAANELQHIAELREKQKPQTDNEAQ